MQISSESSKTKNRSTAIHSANISSWTACGDSWAANSICVRAAGPAIVSKFTASLIAIAIRIAITTTLNSICLKRGRENKKDKSE